MVKFEIKTIIKKILLLNFFLFCVIFSSVAQKFEFGLKGGANVASQKLSDITGVESITGYHLGGFIYFKIPILAKNPRATIMKNTQRQSYNSDK